MGLIDYFRILKALIILFLLYICANYVPNQNGKVQEETLADSNLDAVKTSFQNSTLYQNDLSSFSSSSKISPRFSVTLSHTTESIANGSVG